MDLTADDLARAAQAIHDRDFSLGIFNLLDEIIEQTRVSKLVKTIIHIAEVDGMNYKDAVARAFLDLQALANNIPHPKDELTACALLARLWPIAGAIVGMHTECDSITIHIGMCKLPELVHHFELMALRERDADVKEYYEEWIEYKKRHAQG